MYPKTLNKLITNEDFGNRIRVLWAVNFFSIFPIQWQLYHYTANVCDLTPVAFL